MKIKYIIILFILVAFKAYAVSVTKTHTYSSPLSVDGSGNFGVALTSLSFVAGVDFPVGERINSVTVSIEFHKTDGSCTSPATGNAYHGETSYRLDSPNGKNVILAINDTWSGGADAPRVTVTFSDGVATNPSGTPVSGTFHPKGGNLNDFVNDFAAGDWTLRAGDDAGADPLCIYSYSITINTFTPLPIELLSFSAQLNSENNKTDIIWTTATELNNDFFTIERSADGKTWVDLLFIDGAGVSLEEINYLVTDYSPLNNRSYYRLKQTDYDGFSTYSKIETVLNSKNGFNIYGAKRNIVLENISKVNSIIVYNSSSQVVFSKNNMEVNSFVISNLNSGMYFVKIDNTDVKKVILY